MTKDYRKDCQVVAGPFDKEIAECFEIDDKQVCDLFLQEDCGYAGDILLEPPIGTIADPKECEELCKQFEPLGCKYWIFSQTEKKCSLRTEGDRNCKTWGGPRSPLFNTCMGTTVAPPTTAAPTTAEPATTEAETTAKPDPITTKAETTAKPDPTGTTA